MSENTGHVIMLVDDDEQVLRALRRDLRELGGELITFTDAHEALKVLRERHISLVVSDEKMPGLSGWQFLSLARQIAPATVRVMLTAYADLEAFDMAIQRARIAKLFIKPWDSEVLSESVRHLLTTYVKPDGDAGQNENYTTTAETGKSKAVEIRNGVKTDGI
jgi:DNA-binding NtrC family response regulator